VDNEVDDKDKFESRAITDRAPDPAPAALPKPYKPRVKHPKEIEAENKARKVALQEKKLQQSADQLAKLERIVAPQLRSETPQTAEDFLDKAHAIFQMSMVLQNPSAAATALRLGADIAGVIVSRSAVMSGSPDDFAAARSHDELVSIVERKGGKSLAKLYQEIIKQAERRLENGDYDTADDDAENE
jgi:hypothetical protein